MGSAAVQRGVMVLVIVLALLGSAAFLYWSFGGPPRSVPIAAMPGTRPPETHPGAPLPPPAAIPNAPTPPHPNTARSWPDDPSAAGKPIARGFPIVLPAEVRGTPVTADLDGDGDREVVVSAFVTAHGNKLVHEAPDAAAMLFAFHHDGTPVANWPVAIVETRHRQAELDSGHWYTNIWASAPAAADIDGDGKEEILIVGPRGIGGVVIVYGNGGFRRLAGDADAWGSVPVVDLDEDGRLDVVLGRTQRSTDNRPIPGWRNLLHGGYTPAVGDADGDGHLEVFHPFFEKDGIVGGFRHTGAPVSGWPQRIQQLVLYPVLGDITGDGKMEVVAVDQADRILVWQSDGSALPANAGVQGEPHVFKNGLTLGAGFVQPSLADLDGDGTAEIVTLGPSGELLAWRGDGTRIRPNDPPVTFEGNGRVSIADLGGDGEMDLFARSKWVRVPRDPARPMTVTDMLARPAPISTGCTIADLTGDGMADILFGTGDGRLFVYETGMTLRDEWLQWPTESHDARRTSAWTDPRKKR